MWAPVTLEDEQALYGDGDESSCAVACMPRA
ncbi:MAG: hypothetical protein Ct9H300mP16_05350 [Pseudomonadota bacterium]|nr:MAG: hypothetical protein Ct9H300mP16_05350 [Pseudomonadota bacterium]